MNENQCQGLVSTNTWISIEDNLFHIEENDK